MKRIIIQEEISITQKEVDETIKYYEKVSDSLCIGILCKVLNKKGIIEEIKKLSEIGKEILLMHYKSRELSIQYEQIQKRNRKLKK